MDFLSPLQWGLTRCGPFDKKKASEVFQCPFSNFSDFCNSLKTFFLMIIPKKLDDRVIQENDGMFPSNLPSGVTKNRLLNHSLIFFGDF